MNLGRSVSREFSPRLETGTNLLGSITASLILHLAAITALLSLTPKATRYDIAPTKLDGMIALQKSPARPLHVTDSKTPQLTYATALDDSRNEIANILRQNEHDQLQSSTLLVEKPFLRFVKEIELDNATDLSKDGYVEVEFLINPEGKVVKTTLKSTDIPVEFFELVAQTFEDAEFSPGKRNGVPVFEKLRFRVIFSKSTPH